MVVFSVTFFLMVRYRPTFPRGTLFASWPLLVPYPTKLRQVCGPIPSGMKIFRNVNIIHQTACNYYIIIIIGKQNLRHWKGTI